MSFCHRVTNEGILHFTSQDKPDGCMLRRLDLTEIPLTDAVFMSLAKMPKLEYVNLVKTRCTSDALNDFVRRHPRCLLDHKYSEATKKIGGSFWILNLEKSDDNDESLPMEY